MDEPRLRRTMLMTPGNRPERLAKAVSYPADALIFDLEDGVPPEEKARARSCVAEALRRMSRDGRELCVRINGLDTADGAQDLASLPLELIDSIMVPKVEAAAALLDLEQRLLSAERRLDRTHAVDLIATLETPRGILNALSIADATRRTTALFFGSGDYTSANGAAVTDSTLQFPRSVVAAAAAATRMQAIDAAFFGDVKNAEATRRDAEIARSFGFAGKVVFHPAQVAVVNEVFSPTPAELERARLVVAAYSDHLKKGLGTMVVDGVFVAVDLVPPAQRLLQTAATLAARERSSGTRSPQAG